ncbi:hypothetical protein KB206_10700 [Microvirga sp. STS02]|uniref:hypothetical protein n=1 Tax=Hymenobacter negativus TaxID=2795026 RepID=UPI0018DDA284|nr:MULTISPECIES: hypothetical protein [Bacteria]MBH8569355.1 hypothetical protein [Hymenobacter negativus]MBR7209089.1 hypothetical protein [Microvirga sp. STS02]
MKPVSETHSGQITLPIGGKSHTIRFGLKFVAAFTSKTGEGPADALRQLESAPVEALIEMLTTAIKLSVPADKLPAGLSADMVMDLVDALPGDEQETIWDTLLNAVRRNPIMRSLNKLTAAQ